MFQLYEECVEAGILGEIDDGWVVDEPDTKQLQSKPGLARILP